ncbi:hypothetical protein HMPREF3191_00689 [Veillonellaceae bacterium DNF00626]|nr:hypothetical protein HMPREF3191_00689 [Veillonellaceae bacterium DNF00626]
MSNLGEFTIYFYAIFTIFIDFLKFTPLVKCNGLYLSISRNI